jgi:hypothetical protein
MKPHFIVEELDDNDYPLYGPFYTRETATAFGNLLSNDCKIRELEDPEELRTATAGCLKAYDDAVMAELTNTAVG